MATSERLPTRQTAPAELHEPVGRSDRRVPQSTAPDPASLITAIRELIAGEVERRLGESDRPPVAPSASRFVTVEEAAGLLRCKPQRVYDLLSQRRLSRVKEGGRTLLLRDEVEGLPETTTPAR